MCCHRVGLDLTFRGICESDVVCISWKSYCLCLHIFSSIALKTYLLGHIETPGSCFLSHNSLFCVLSHFYYNIQEKSRTIVESIIQIHSGYFKSLCFFFSSCTNYCAFTQWYLTTTTKCYIFFDLHFVTFVTCRYWRQHNSPVIYVRHKCRVEIRIHKYDRMTSIGEYSTYDFVDGV